MNQVQRVLKSNSPVHKMSDRSYKGSNPEFTTMTNPKTGQQETIKTSRGVPFVKL